MTTMIAVKALRYAGVSRQPGEEFECTSAKHEKLLLVLGRATVKVPDAPAPAPAMPPDAPAPAMPPDAPAPAMPRRGKAKVIAAQAGALVEGEGHETRDMDSES